MAFKESVILSHPIGSRYVCDPPVMDTDKDTLCLVWDIPASEQLLLAEGWTPCCNGEYVDTYFKAYRKGEDNYVITASQTYFTKYVTAAEVCKALNVQCKNTRIAIHKACVEASGGHVGLVNW